MKNRIISAFIMLLIAVPCLILGNWPLIFLSLFILLVGNYELLKCCDLHINKFETIIFYLLAGAIYFKFIFNNNVFTITYYLVILLFFILISFNKNVDLSKLSIYFICFIILTTAVSFIFDYIDDTIYLIFIISTNCLTDTFALFGGMLFGKHKLCPHISPNKTIEGCIVGTICGTILGSLIYNFFIDNRSYFIIISISLCLSIAGQIGDLFFSKVKRHFGIKDFGNLIPGHGGVIDRIDSISFGIIVYIIIEVLI